MPVIGISAYETFLNLGVLEDKMRKLEKSFLDNDI